MISKSILDLCDPLMGENRAGISVHTFDAVQRTHIKLNKFLNNLEGKIESIRYSVYRLKDERIYEGAALQNLNFNQSKLLPATFHRSIVSRYEYASSRTDQLVDSMSLILDQIRSSYSKSTTVTLALVPGHMGIPLNE